MFDGSQWRTSLVEVKLKLFACANIFRGASISVGLSIGRYGAGCLFRHSECGALANEFNEIEA
jgi:hypothetical protein